MNKRKEVNRTLLQVRNMANGSKLHWDIDQVIVDQIQEMVTIIRNMFGINVSKSVLARRALQAYHDELRDLVRNGSNPKFKSSQKKLLNYMASVESERMALFQAANKPQDVANPKFGVQPSAKELTGVDLDLAPIAQELAQRMRIILQEEEEE